MIKGNLTHRSLEVGLFINPEFNLAWFDCFDQWSKFKSYGSDFRIGHQAPWSKDFPDPTDNAHHIRSGHHSFEVKPSFLDFFGKILSADKVCTGVMRFLHLLALGKNQDPDVFSQSMGKGTGSTNHLVCFTWINPKSHWKFDRFVKFCRLDRFDQIDCFIKIMKFVSVHFGVDQFGAFWWFWHRVSFYIPSTRTPMLRAVPATIFIAACTS